MDFACVLGMRSSSSRRTSTSPNSLVSNVMIRVRLAHDDYHVTHGRPPFLPEAEHPDKKKNAAKFVSRISDATAYADANTCLLTNGTLEPLISGAIVTKIVFVMASIYKHANRAELDSEDSDASISDASSQTMDDDAATSSDENDERVESRSNGLAKIPVELRNRILMLTSRGVSFRWVHAFCV